MLRDKLITCVCLFLYFLRKDYKLVTSERRKLLREASMDGLSMHSCYLSLFHRQMLPAMMEYIYLLVCFFIMTRFLSSLPPLISTFADILACLSSDSFFSLLNGTHKRKEMSNIARGRR
jgi:hypothetical protein